MTDDHDFPDHEHAAERYLLGDMSDSEREQYEQHFFSCAECADDLRTTARFLEDVGRYAAPPAGGDRGRPANVAALLQKRPRALRSLFWPLPAGAAAAAAVLLAIIGYQAFDVAGLRRELSSEQRLQSVPSYFLTASRSEAPAITVSSRQRKIALAFGRFDRQFPFYRCEIRDAGGRLVLSAVLDPPASGDELQVQVPVGGLRPDVYTVTIAGLESAAAAASPAEPARYQFSLRREH